MSVSKGIAFFVMSSSKLPWRSAAINATWKQMLAPADVIAFSESNTTYHQAQKDHYDLLRRTERVDVDWTCLVDDDAFVNVPGLKTMLSHLNTTKPQVVGHVLRSFECLWCGAGMILSREARERIVLAIRSGAIKPPHMGMHKMCEDGHCWRMYEAMRFIRDTHQFFETTT